MPFKIHFLTCFSSDHNKITMANANIDAPHAGRLRIKIAYYSLSNFTFYKWCVTKVAHCICANNCEMYVFFAFWIIFHIFVVVCEFLKYIFQKLHSGTLSENVFVLCFLDNVSYFCCRLDWRGSKLFVKVISRRQKSSLVC